MPDDVVRLIDAMDERYRAAVWVGALLGLRWGEVFGLRVGQLDWPTRTLTVSEIVTRDDHGRPVVGASEVCRRKSHSLSMPQLLVDMLAEHLTRFGLTTDAPDSYVFQRPEVGRGPIPTSAAAFGCQPSPVRAWTGSGFTICAG